MKSESSSLSNMHIGLDAFTAVQTAKGKMTVQLDGKALLTFCEALRQREK